MKKLQEFVNEYFIGTNEVKGFISERGNQRIEIKNLEDGEIWQTLEAVSQQEDMSNFDDIADAVMSALIQQSIL